MKAVESRRRRIVAAAAGVFQTNAGEFLADGVAIGLQTAIEKIRILFHLFSSIWNRDEIHFSDHIVDRVQCAILLIVAPYLRDDPFDGEFGLRVRRVDIARYTGL